MTAPPTWTVGPRTPTAGVPTIAPTGSPGAPPSPTALIPFSTPAPGAIPAAESLWLGLEVDPNDSGVLVITAISAAGQPEPLEDLEVGDQIISLNGEPIVGLDAWDAAMGDLEPAQILKLGIRRVALQDPRQFFVDRQAVPRDISGSPASRIESPLTSTAGAQ